MKRILSGIRANSDLTIGNYLGALKRWVELAGGAKTEPEQDGTEYIFFIPNLHSLTARPEPSALHMNTLSNAAWYVAAGLDPTHCIFFVQSQVPAHAELAWILSNYVTMGELGRMTQFKDKVKKGGSDGQLAGLFTYPALMAADILLYDADEVPVGDDQLQHVELVRDIAARFNNLYSLTFKLPQATLPRVGARIMNLQDPAAKMSKSDQDQSGNIMLSDDVEAMRQKLGRAVTDSGDEVRAGEDKPALTNLLTIFAATTGRSMQQLEHDYAGKGYGKFKADLADAVVAHLEPIQRRHDELMSDQTQLLAILEAGRNRAADIAEDKLSQVKHILGLL